MWESMPLPRRAEAILAIFIIFMKIEYFIFIHVRHTDDVDDDKSKADDGGGGHWNRVLGTVTLSWTTK